MIGASLNQCRITARIGVTAFDLAATVHPNPTLPETLMEAADHFYGHATHALDKTKKA